MPIRKTNHCYDLDRCLVEWELIQLRLGDKLWDSDKVLGTGIYGYNRQTCLQRSNKSVGNPYTDAAGARREWTFSRWEAPKAKKKSIIKDQSEYTVLNEVYEGTVFADIIQDVNGERARIMEMNPSTTYTVHRDNSPRYHLALITNPNAYFIFPTLNQIMHIPADGCLYEVDTTILHSFVNCGPDRTHLVISKRSSS
jgi:hypothetical protein